MRRLNWLRHCGRLALVEGVLATVHKGQRGDAHSPLHYSHELLYGCPYCGLVGTREWFDPDPELDLLLGLHTPAERGV